MSNISRIGKNSFALPPLKTNNSSLQEIKPQSSNQVKDQVNLGNSSPKEAKVPKKWAILHYTAADNDLITPMKHDVNEMELIGSSEETDVISMLDQGGDNCKIYHLEQDDDMYLINSPVIKDMGNTNMADPKVLSEFISSMMEEYPAEHYAVIIGDHGQGWKGAIADDTSRGFMSLPDIGKAFEDAQNKTGKKVDIIGFDACLMATGEVADELKNSADYLVASQETEGGEGWPYNTLINSKGLRKLNEVLRMKLDVSPRDLAARMVDNAQNDPSSLPTLSAMDLSKMDKYEQATTKLAEAMMKSNTPNKTFKNLARKTQSFYEIGARDHYHFAKLISESQDINDNELKEAAKDLMKTIKEDVVINEQHSQDYFNANGITAEIPALRKPGKAYKELQFAKNTKWDEAIEQKF